MIKKRGIKILIIFFVLFSFFTACTESKTSYNGIDFHYPVRHNQTKVYKGTTNSAVINTPDGDVYIFNKIFSERLKHVIEENSKFLLHEIVLENRYLYFYEILPKNITLLFYAPATHPDQRRQTVKNMTQTLYKNTTIQNNPR